MASNDSLTQQHEQEFRRFKRRVLSGPQRIVIAALIAIIALFLLHAIANAPSDSYSVETSRRALRLSGTAWGQQFAESQERLSDWFDRHGIGLEQSTFNRVSSLLLESAQRTVSRMDSNTRPGFFTGAWLSLHAGTLRIAFVILAALRLLIALTIFALVMAQRTFGIYRGDDPLGQTSNGRIFFSGARVSLDKVSAEGAPADQIRGLACPEMVAESVAQSSPMGRTLERYGALNKTNLELVAIILRYREMPDHVSEPGEESALSSFYNVGHLGSYAELLLEEVLKAHAALKQGQELPERQYEQPLSQVDYTHLLACVLGHALSTNLRGAAALVPPTVVATLMLALEAGKVLAFSYEGGKWTRKSQYPNLCGRAVMHSVTSLSKDYDFATRTMLRRALVYARRASSFAPIKFPVDLSLEARALRQWAELLQAAPHTLMQTAAEVELLGLMHQIHEGWERIFFEGVAALDPDILQNVYSGGSQLLFMPLGSIVKLLRRVVPAQVFEQLDQLVTVVHHHQSLEAVQRTDEGNDSTAPVVHERVFAPLSSPAMRDLAAMHEVSLDDLRAWSALRIVLHHYGWLGRRVSERTVPDSSVVFCVLKLAEHSKTMPTTPVPLTGLSGMVPLRATRCQERWGKLWTSRFTQAEWARMAENRKDFEKLLRGEADDLTDTDSEEEDGVQSVVPAS